MNSEILSRMAAVISDINECFKTDFLEQAPLEIGGRFSNSSIVGTQAPGCTAWAMRYLCAHCVCVDALHVRGPRTYGRVGVALGGHVARSALAMARERVLSLFASASPAYVACCDRAQAEA